VVHEPTPEHGEKETGNVEEPAQDEGPTTGLESVTPSLRAATAKRKRNTKAEQSVIDGPAPKSRANPAARTVNQRKLAPAPALAPAPTPQWAPEVQVVPTTPSRNGNLANNANNGVQGQIARSSSHFYQPSSDLTGLTPLPLPSYSFQTPSFNQDPIGPGHGYVSSSHAQEDSHFFQALRSSSHGEQQLPFFQTTAPTSSAHFSPQHFPLSSADTPFGQPQFINPFAQAQQQSYVGMSANNIPTRNSHYNAAPQYLNHDPSNNASGISLSPEVSQTIRNAGHGMSQYTGVSDFGMDNNFKENSMSDEEFLQSFGMFNPNL